MPYEVTVMKAIPSDMIKGFKHTNNAGLEFEIVNYNKTDDVDVMFTDSGNIKKTQAAHIRRGVVKDELSISVYGVGFIGKGEFKAGSGTGHTKEYKLWHGMLERCYSKAALKKRPTYRGVTVCKEWNNFQNFALWCQDYKSEIESGMQLDKDKLSGDKKIYSPETCAFVTTKENIQLAHCRDRVLISPSGNEVSVENVSEFCRATGLHRSGISTLCSGGLKTFKGWKLKH